MIQGAIDPHKALPFQSRMVAPSFAETLVVAVFKIAGVQFPAANRPL